MSEHETVFQMLESDPLVRMMMDDQVQQSRDTTKELVSQLANKMLQNQEMFDRYSPGAMVMTFVRGLGEMLRDRPLGDHVSILAFLLAVRLYDEMLEIIRQRAEQHRN